MNSTAEKSATFLLVGLCCIVLVFGAGCSWQGLDMPEPYAQPTGSDGPTTDTAFQTEADSDSEISISDSDSDSDSDSGSETESIVAPDTESESIAEAATCVDEDCETTVIVGGPNGHYPNLQSAVDDLNAKGVTSCVVLCLAAGTYEGQVTIPAITGVSEVAPLKIRSHSRNSSMVVLAYSATTSANDWVLKLDGSSHVTLSQVTLQSNGRQFGTALSLENEASFNSIENVVFKTTSQADPRLVSISGTNQGNSFRSSKFIGGGTGLYVWSSKFDIHDLSIAGNEFSNQSNRGLELHKCQKFSVVSNTVTATTISDGYKGVVLSNCSQGWRFSRNKVIAISGIGLWVRYSFGLENDINKIDNNFVRVLGNSNAGINVAVQFDNATATRIDFNTFVIGSSGGIGSMVLNVPVIEGAVSGIISAKNNIFANLSFGLVTNLEHENLLIDCDFNNLYTEGGILGMYGSKHNPAVDLWAWRNLTGIDLSSESTSITFASESDFRICEPALDGIGMPLPEYPMDLDGSPRDLSSPDVGCDEFDYPACLQNMTSMVIPIGD